MAESVCPGCHGKPYLHVIAQRWVEGKRVYTEEQLPCLICKGTGQATAQDFVEWEAQGQRAWSAKERHDHV